MCYLGRLQWAQKVPSMLHATTLTITGLNVVLQALRAGHGLLQGRNELVAAFLGLELAYILQVISNPLSQRTSF